MFPSGCGSIEFRWNQSQNPVFGGEVSDSLTAMWSRLCHSQRTSPVLMSISSTAVSRITPLCGPPADVRLQLIGLYAVT